MSRQQPVISAVTRRDVVDLAGQVGAAEASRRTGYKSATIRQWMKRASDVVAVVERVDQELPPPPSPAAVSSASPPVPVSTADAKANWTAKRGSILAGVTNAAERIARELETMDLGDGRRARYFAITLGVLIDKALLLTGAPTSLSHSTSTSVAYHVDASGPSVAAQLADIRAQLGIGEGGSLVAGSIETTGSDT